MKDMIKIMLLLVLTVTAFISCKKQISEIKYEGGTNPVFSASSVTPLVLLLANKDNPVITFSWTNPNYYFSTGISSQDVTYILQFDSSGRNFASSKLQETSISKDLSVTLTVKELNQVLTKMEMASGVPHSIDIRVKSVLVNNAAPLYSNVLKISINPYLDFAVEPPGTPINQYLDGKLWIVGDAVASGWSNPLPGPYDVSQQFSRTGGNSDVLHYQATITFNATGGYKLIQEQGDWSKQYHAVDGTAKLSGVFKKANSDPTFPSPGAGSYKVEFNFQTGKYTLTKL